MNKKENRMAVRQAAQQAVIRDEQNHRIEHAATNPIKEVLKSLHTTLRGLDAENVAVSRTKYGSNKVTHEKKQSHAFSIHNFFLSYAWQLKQHTEDAVCCLTGSTSV